MRCAASGSQKSRPPCRSMTKAERQGWGTNSVRLFGAKGWATSPGHPEDAGAVGVETDLMITKVPKIGDNACQVKRRDWMRVNPTTGNCVLNAASGTRP